MERSLTLVVLIASLGAPSACSQPEARMAPLLEAPQLAWAQQSTPPGEPLSPIIRAYQQQDCQTVLLLSDEWMRRIHAEVVEIFHDVDASRRQARRVRRFLDQMVYTEPPGLEIGPHGFEFASWWVQAYGYCLIQQAQWSRAIDLYRTLYRLHHRPMVLWSLALAYAWSGQSDTALEWLGRWPAGEPLPFGYVEVTEYLRRGEPVPEYIQEVSVQVH